MTVKDGCSNNRDLNRGKEDGKKKQHGNSVPSVGKHIPTQKAYHVLSFEGMPLVC